jgi:Flp pilus assembly protein TadD
MIHGLVRDAVNHLPLQHVLVTLERETSGNVAQTETDAMGKFVFDGPGESIFIVRLKPPGYEERTQRVDLETNSTDYVTFDLKPTSRQPGSTVASGPEANINANDSAAPEKARKEYEKGRKLFAEEKDPQKGVSHLQAAVKLYDKYEAAYILLGIAYIDLGRIAEARATLEKALSLDEKSSQANITMGMLLNHLKDFAGAEKFLSRAVELSPDAPQAHYELAKSDWALGRWQDAAPHVQRALELKPDLAEAHVLMGNVDLRKGDGRNAVAEFREYLRLEPNGSMAAAAQQMIAKIGQQDDGH